MKSEWKVTSQYINGQKQYAVYRLKDTSAIDHSGNREYSSNYTANRDIAQTLANLLNEEEKIDNQL